MRSAQAINLRTFRCSFQVFRTHCIRGPFILPRWNLQLEKMLPAVIEATFPGLCRLNSTTCWLFWDILGSLWPFFTRIPVPCNKNYRNLVPNVFRSSHFPDVSPLADFSSIGEESHWLWPGKCSTDSPTDSPLSWSPVCFSFLLTVPVRQDLFPLPIQIWSVSPLNPHWPRHWYRGVGKLTWSPSPVTGLKEIVEIKILWLFLLH